LNLIVSPPSVSAENSGALAPTFNIFHVLVPALAGAGKNHQTQTAGANSGRSTIAEALPTNGQSN
jgi:hypothetical protein